MVGINNIIYVFHRIFLEKKFDCKYLALQVEVKDGCYYCLANSWCLPSQPMCRTTFSLLFLSLLHVFHRDYHKCEEHVQFNPNVKI